MSGRCTGRHRGPTDPLLPLTFKTTCLHCGIQVGRPCEPAPANDADERVQVEIRAAEIAADEHEMSRMMTGPIDGEVNGFILACQVERGFREEAAPVDAHWQAGYLARCIATHEDP